MPAPLTVTEWAIWNWTAINPPEEIPDIEVWLASMFNAGKVGAALSAPAIKEMAASRVLRNRLAGEHAK